MQRCLSVMQRYGLSSYTWQKWSAPSARFFFYLDVYLKHSAQIYLSSPRSLFYFFYISSREAFGRSKFDFVCFRTLVLLRSENVTPFGQWRLRSECVLEHFCSKFDTCSNVERIKFRRFARSEFEPED